MAELAQPAQARDPLRVEAAAAPGSVPAERRLWARSLRVLRRRLLTVFSLLLLVLIGLAALFAPYLSPHDPTQQELGKRFVPPVWQQGGTPEHPLGTDHLGRDVLSRTIYGSRVSVTVGIAAVGFGLVIGSLLGLVAAYYGGWFETLIMRLADVQLALPHILLAIILVVALKPGLVTIVIVLIIRGWVIYARVARSAVLSLKEQDFVLAARSQGAGDLRILFRHLLPNFVSSTLVLGTLQLGQAIILESSLSFLGLGVQPPTPTWGSMLAEGRNYLLVVWWLATIPGVALFLTVLAVNLLGDWLRDVLDPKFVER